MKVKIGSGGLMLSDMAKMCSGRLCGKNAENIRVESICTDSREAERGALFAALRGEKVDGHDYIPTAAGLGSAAFLCERMPTDISDECGVILVDDTQKALAALAGEYKKRLHKVVTVGVTGSVGKTTTKEFISAVLARRFNTFKTEGNHNSVIGMPLSVMEMTSDAEAAVFEMGMSALGEISLMSRVAMPDIGVITTIGTSHIEMLGSRENILRAKTEIIDGMSEDGILLLSGDEPLFVSADKKGRKCLYVATENRDADFRALNIRTDMNGTVFDLLTDGRIYSNIELPIMGRHNVYAALFAFAVGMLLGMSEEDIRQGLADFKSPGMRQHIYDIGGVTVIEDCYNASPESMHSAIDLLFELSEKKGARAAALLGDMLELGEAAPAMHAEIGAYLVSKGCKLLFTCGTLAESIAEAAAENGMSPENIYVNCDSENAEKTENMLLHALLPGDVLLVKASRGMAMERFIEYLKNNLNF